MPAPGVVERFRAPLGPGVRVDTHVEDGSVVPIIGGLPAAEGSAWDIGAPVDERGAALAEHEASQEHQAGQEDTH